MLGVKMNAKMEALKDLVSQMYKLMSDGHGESEEAGKDAMEAISEGESPVAEKAEEACEPEGGDDIRSAVREAFKGKPKAPSKGAMIVMESKTAMPMKKDGEELMARRKKGKGGMNYG